MRRADERSGIHLSELRSAFLIQFEETGPMCRNIRVLFNFEPQVTDEEIHDAALQYVRKVSGYARPSHENGAAFARAVVEVAGATRRLIELLVTEAPSRDRELEIAKARERARSRFGGPGAL